jgi:hypothetical protein
MTTRPETFDLDQGLEAWDAIANANRAKGFEQPLPVHEHDGDESDLESAFPAAQFGNSLVWVNHSVLGWVLYCTDGNSAWRQYSQRERTSFRLFGTAGTLDDWDRVVFYNGGSPATLVLAPAANTVGAIVHLKQIGTGTLTVDANGAENIDGSANWSASAQYDGITVYSDGSNWYILSETP